MVSALITIALILFAIVVMTRALSRSREQFAGRNRCPYCRAHLRRSADKLRFADVCRKCGRTMPWAKVA
jgi:hypothetical protein